MREAGKKIESEVLENGRDAEAGKRDAGVSDFRRLLENSRVPEVV